MNNKPSYEKDLKKNYDKINDLYMPKDFKSIVENDVEVLERIFNIVDNPNEYDDLFEELINLKTEKPFIYKDVMFKYKYNRLHLVNFLPFINTLYDDNSPSDWINECKELIQKFEEKIIKRIMGRSHDSYEMFKNKSYDEKIKEFDDYFEGARKREIDQIIAEGEKVKKENDKKLGIKEKPPDIPNNKIEKFDEDAWDQQMKNWADDAEKQAKIKIKEKEKAVKLAKEEARNAAIRAAKEEDDKKEADRILAEKEAKEKIRVKVEKEQAAAAAKKKAEDDAAAAKKKEEDAAAAKKKAEEDAAAAAKKAEEEDAKKKRLEEAKKKAATKINIDYELKNIEHLWENGKIIDGYDLSKSKVLIINDLSNYKNNNNKDLKSKKYNWGQTFRRLYKLYKKQESNNPTVYNEALEKMKKLWMNVMKFGNFNQAIPPQQQGGNKKSKSKKTLKKITKKKGGNKKKTFKSKFLIDI